VKPKPSASQVNGRYREGLDRDLFSASAGYQDFNGSGETGLGRRMSAAAALAEQGIHADRDGLHLLPPEQAKESATLQEECKEFLGKTQQFGEIISDFITVMESRAKVIESEKLKAIGLGNRVDSEQETRKRKQLEMQVGGRPV